MKSKLQAARIVTAAGVHLVIANGRAPGVLEKVLAGEDVGTLFVASARKMESRKRWIAFYHRPTGYLVVDDGAKGALIGSGRSLLARGVVETRGVFAAGDVVAIRDRDGIEFARGVVRLGSADIAGAGQGRTKPEVVHRNDLVLL
jgi:glutamate 5-kinase